MLGSRRWYMPDPWVTSASLYSFTHLFSWVVHAAAVIPERQKYAKAAPRIFHLSFSVMFVHIQVNHILSRFKVYQKRINDYRWNLRAYCKLQHFYKDLSLCLIMLELAWKPTDTVQCAQMLHSEVNLSIEKCFASPQMNTGSSFFQWQRLCAPLSVTAAASVETPTSVATSSVLAGALDPWIQTALWVCTFNKAFLTGHVLTGCSEKAQV